MDVGEVVVEQVQGVWVFTLRGEHDISVEPSLQQEVERAFDAGSTVIVDLSEVAFMDSSVLRALAYGSKRASEHADDRIRIVAPPDSHPRRLLAMTGLDAHVPISDTRAEALTAIEADLAER